MKVWVIEFDHGPHAKGVSEVSTSLDEAVKRIQSRSSVEWEPLAKAVLGGAWILNGTWRDGAFADRNFVTYRFTEHEVRDDMNDCGKISK